MANENEQNKPAATPSGTSAKRATTIDLKATEIRSDAGEPVEQTDGAASASAAPEVADNPPRGDGPLERRQPGGSTWPMVGVAAAAAIVFFGVGLGAGQWLAGHAPLTAQVAAPGAIASSPEVLARIAKLETQLSVPAKDDVQIQARIAKIEAQVGASRTDDTQLQTRLAKLEAAVSAPRADDQQLLARVAAAEASVKTLSDMAVSRERRSDDIAAIAHEARDRASTAAEAAKGQQGGSPDARAEIDALAGKVATLEQVARSSQAELARRATADDAKGRFAIAAIALRDSVDSALPFQAELSSAKALSGDANAFAPLEPFASSGVPSAATLGRELAGLMPAIWKVARKDEAQQGTFLERLQANASKIVRVRPAGDVVGDDPTSVSARIETRADNADIRGALTELSKLPTDARAPAEAWIKKAQARNAAIAAARNISQTALGALAKSGS